MPKLRHGGFGTEHTGLGEVFLQGDGLREVGDAHQSVALSVVGFGQQVVGHGVSLFQGNGLLGGFGHGGVVLLHVADVGQGEPRVGVRRLQLGHAFQLLTGLVQLVDLYVRANQVAAGLEVVVQGQCLGETLDGVVLATHPLGADAVILEDVEVLLPGLFLFGHRVVGLAREE